MTEHVFRLGAIDGEHDVEPLTAWLRDNTERGIVSAETFKPTLLETYTVNSIGLTPSFTRVFWMVTVHSDDEAFWTRMRWAEDINAYARTKERRDRQDAELRAQIEETNREARRWFNPSTHGPSTYSMGAAQSKYLIPLADPKKAAAITETGREILHTMASEVKKVVVVEGESDFLRIFGGPSDDDLSFTAMTNYLAHSSPEERDPEK